MSFYFILNLSQYIIQSMFSAERIKIEIDGQKILWRDMTLKVDSRIGEHTMSIR